MTRILIVRGHLVTPWELRPWLELPERFEVRCLLTSSNQFTPPAAMEFARVHALRDYLPSGRLGDFGALALGDRYLGARRAFAWADIVHAEELGFWFAADAARRRQRRPRGAKLVQTVWETLPLLDTFRNGRARDHRREVLAATDLFLPTTERAALALRLEGVAPDRIRVCSPGIDVERFTHSPRVGRTSEEHVIISPGRLVWEKGHQDVLRALALLHRGLITAADGRPIRPRLRIIGHGPEAARLAASVEELGLTGVVEIGGVPYDQMPEVFATASAMVLASQSSATAALHPFDIPHAFWEEQFGMVLAEAMASGLDIIASSSGAIPEVLAGTPAILIAPGDWVGLARALADGPLSRPPGTRIAYPPSAVEHYSTRAAGARLAAAYDSLED